MSNYFGEINIRDKKMFKIYICSNIDLLVSFVCTNQRVINTLGNKFVWNFDISLEANNIHRDDSFLVMKFKKFLINNKESIFYCIGTTFINNNIVTRFNYILIVFRLYI